MKRILRLVLFLGMVVVMAPGVHATIINYSLTDRGSNQWEYGYTVTNDTLGVDLEGFTISFDSNLYGSLAVSNSGLPDGWSGDILPTDPFSGMQLFDAYSSPGITPGSSLGVFSVSFTWLGAGSPGSQLFEVYDLATFEPLDSGRTTATSVPEPSTLFLLGMGTGLLIAVSLTRKLDLSKKLDMRKLRLRWLAG
jgi:hypothetical protein